MWIQVCLEQGSFLRWNNAKISQKKITDSVTLHCWTNFVTVQDWLEVKISGCSIPICRDNPWHALLQTYTRFPHPPGLCAGHWWILHQNSKQKLSRLLWYYFMSQGTYRLPCLTSMMALIPFEAHQRARFRVNNVNNNNGSNSKTCHGSPGAT